MYHFDEHFERYACSRFGRKGNHPPRQHYPPFNFSSFSSLVLQSMQKVVTGLAINLFSDMEPPQASQMPKVRSSIRWIASRIFKTSSPPRSRMRSSNFLPDSREALSLGSGNFRAPHPRPGA